MEDFLSRISQYSPKRLALLADELQRRVTALELAPHAPIAIVGMACRFPGGADTPAKFWDLLCRGEDAITEVPAERWSIADYYDPDPDAPGKMSSRWGGFLRDVDLFDTRFFGISPREAQRIDPQQRLLLEVAWEALEHAGVNADRLAETRTGVFIGMSSVDYLQLMRSGGLPSFDAYTASGAAHSIASGRLSYLLGARGPSMTIDTACSSSMVALHQAVVSLRRGESDLALTGGVNLILRPDVTVALSRAHMMAPDGRCKVFDSRADGFVRSEGCGIVVLKRLSDAQRDGDPVIAVIRGTASNQDGRSNGLTAPNGTAQEAVVRAALDDARLTPADVQFVETHGTGTSLGDPIEVQALSAVLGAGRTADRALLIGSVKASIGHSEAAAGVASIIKLALCIEHGLVPAQQHFVRPNPFIPWDELPVRVPVAVTPWPVAAGGERVGGASSFGFSGSNVHVLLSSAPPRKTPEAAMERPRHVLTVSARSDEARLALVTAYQRELGSEASPSLADIAFTANAGRAALPHRFAVVASTKEEASMRLGEIASGASSTWAVAGIVPSRPPRIAFLFTGQGAQYAGMARALYDSQPLFRRSLDECDALLKPRLAQPLLSVLYPTNATESPINDTAYTQPALFAVEYALAMLWKSWGIQPTAVIGHSVGEYVAACVAGVLSLESALMLVAERGRLMGALPRNGAMAALSTNESQAKTLIAPWSAEVAIAAVNGPEHVVVSGRDTAIDAIIERATAGGLRATRLTVSHAFHSPLVEPMLGEFHQIAGRVTYRPASLDVVSNVTGELMGPRAFDAAYWRDHVRAPVQFARGIQALARLGVDTFVEIGPHPTLLGMARQCLEDEALLWLPSLRRGTDEWDQISSSLATLYTRGAAVDWAGFDAGYARRKVLLPTYPFQRERFWVDVTAAGPDPATQAAERTSVDRANDMVHEIVWRERAAPSAGLLSPGVVRKLVSPRIADIAADSGIPAYEPFVGALDKIATSYIVKALQALGADLHPGTVFRADELRDRLGVIPRHHRLFARLLEILTEDGLVVSEGQRFRGIGPFTVGDLDAESRRLSEQHPNGIAELTITSRCAGELAAVLRGEADPLPLLFPGGSLADMERLYRTSPPAKTYNRLIAEAVATLVDSWSRDRPIRILEIGGGTGSTTAWVLPSLRDDAVEYTFTDLSPLFLNRAKDTFSERTCMRYAVLDISTDPAAQGFAPGAFDIIIGANVVHATPDLAISLTNARTLLGPGGHIILLEGSTPQRFGDLTVGLLEGWWSFTDLHRRKYALMPRDAWLTALKEAGFPTPTVIVDADMGPVLEQQAILVAQTPIAQPAANGARWLVVPDSGGVAPALSASLRGIGDEAVELARGEGALRSALDEARRAGNRIAGVIHLAALDVRMDDTTPTATLWADQERLVQSALDTVQTLATVDSNPPPALWFVTRGAQPTREGEACNPAQAPVWGMSHVVALEYPDLACRRVDLDPSQSPVESLPSLVAELRTPSREDQIALRGDRRLARRLVRKKAASPAKAPSIGPDRTYLVTGGLRGLGLQVAEWLVQQGARSIVLASRRPPDDAIEGKLRQFRALGAQVVVMTCDVAREEDVRRVLDEISRTLPPLRGIVHSAGVLDDGVLTSQTWARFATVMAPKVLGTWHLHRLAGPLDFFVLFSSGAAIAGSPGQANHAAANAFEDALAWYRQSRGQPSVSINWGPWAEVGAAAERHVTGPSFLRLIPPPDGLRAFGAALAPDGERPRLDSAQVVVLASNWEGLSRAPAAWRNSPLFSELAPAARTVAQAATAQATVAEPSLRDRLSSTIPNRRRAALQDHVQMLTQRVLGVQEASAFDVNEPLRQMGLDSLMAVELRNLLAKAVGRPMPSTVTFDHPSVSALVDYLAGEMLGDELFSPAAPIAAAAPIQTPAEPDIPDDLSSAELASRLAERLDRIAFEEPK